MRIRACVSYVAMHIAQAIQPLILLLLRPRAPTRETPPFQLFLVERCRMPDTGSDRSDLNHNVTCKPIPTSHLPTFFRNLTKKRTFFFVFFVRPNFPFPELKSKTLYRPRSLWYPLALSHCRHYHHTTTTTSDLSLATR